MYGLAGAVFTKDIQKALKVAHGIRAGTFWVNCYNVFDAGMPFGGFKQSVRSLSPNFVSQHAHSFANVGRFSNNKQGQGRELCDYGLLNYLEVKAVCVKLDGADAK